MSTYDNMEPKLNYEYKKNSLPVWGNFQNAESTIQKSMFINTKTVSSDNQGGNTNENEKTCQQGCHAVHVNMQNVSHVHDQYFCLDLTVGQG